MVPTLSHGGRARHRPPLTPLVLLALASLVLVVAAGCGPRDSGQRAAVRVYAEALPVALSGTSLEPIRAVATPAETERVRLYVMQLVGEKRRLDARLLELTYASVETSSAEKAVVVTRERWRTSVIERPAEAPAERRSEVRYHLVRDRGRWLVDAVEEEPIAP